MKAEEIQKKLAEPFPSKSIGWKPQSVKGNRALALAYIDARDVEDRLDNVVGVGNWKDHYDVLADGSVVCQLSVRIECEWITKTDVGSQSEQPDSGDRMKAAFSDALKRAAVKYGIGRYLYSLSNQWCDYDTVKRAFVDTPTLPDWALPEDEKRKPTTPQRQQKPASTPFNTNQLMNDFVGCATKEQYELLISQMVKIKDKLSDAELTAFRDEAKRLSAKFGSAK